ncbi:HlyU family transcriptional regulator [Vibrio sp. TH_r3]|uniref:HlyU family transcriptional regulator n=1 Tax=Vibrio sp. TH_r3 TaxID=3082084 RepID=UPI002953D4EB|nr:HlyU family transcriptional regulator [Vibrio sp. TH_r3]MDV7103506.1 HlyU family transcriptional regulator [Vibrio sp. TH_r3]
MGFFSKLFGSNTVSSPKVQVEPVEYEGFLIYPDAKPESSQYRIAGRITKERDGEIQEHNFIRSDVVASKETANELMLTKAKMFIDQMRGEIF